MKTMKHTSRYWCTLGLFVALMLIMSFTPLGYVRFGIIEISLLTLPIAVAAALLDFQAAVLLGAIFGLSSFFQCFGMSPFGAMLLSIQPVYTFLMCFVPRILIGVFGSLYSHAVKNKNLRAFGIPLLSALTNTVFFLGFVLLFFGSSEYIQSFGSNVWAILLAMGVVNAAIEIPACTLVGGVLIRVLEKANIKME